MSMEIHLCVVGERTVFLQLKLLVGELGEEILFQQDKYLYFNLFVVPQASQFSSSGQTKFILDLTCV